MSEPAIRINFWKSHRSRLAAGSRYTFVYGVHAISVSLLAFVSARVARPLESAFVKT